MEYYLLSPSIRESEGVLLSMQNKEDGKPRQKEGPKLFNKLSALVGIIAPIIFVSTFLSDELLTSGYNLIERPISDLALVTGHGWIQSVNFAILGILLFLFALGFPALIRTLHSRRLVGVSSVLLAISGATYVLVAIFPAQSEGESPLAFHVIMHSVGFSTIFLSFGLACILFGITAARSRSRHRLLAGYSIATALFPIIAALANLSSTGAVSSGFTTFHYAGVLTQVLVVIALSWYVILGSILIMNRSFPDRKSQVAIGG